MEQPQTFVTLDGVWHDFEQEPFYRDLAAMGVEPVLITTQRKLASAMRDRTWLPMHAWTTPLVLAGVSSVARELTQVEKGVALLVLDTVEEFVVFAVNRGTLAVNATVVVIQIQRYWQEVATRTP